MKTTISLLLLALLSITLLLTGCASLFPGFNTAEAQAIAEKRQAELQATADRVDQLEGAVREARDAYEKARREGDEKAIIAAGQVLAAKLGELDLGKQDLDSARNAFDSAVQDFKDAKGAGEYLNVILGSLGGILGAFGIGVPVARGMVKRRDEALSITAASADALPEDALLKFKAAQAAGFAGVPGAQKVLNKARGK